MRNVVRIGLPHMYGLPEHLVLFQEIQIVAVLLELDVRIKIKPLNTV